MNVGVMDLIDVSDGYQMEIVLRRFSYNISHARKKAKEMVEKKLQSIVLKNEQAANFS